MSFFTSPSRYLREALLARRAHQREEAHAARLLQRREHQQQQQHHENQNFPPPLPQEAAPAAEDEPPPLEREHGRRRHPHPHRRRNHNRTVEEDDFDFGFDFETEKSSSIHFTSTWKSIGDFFPTIFSPKQLELEEDEADQPSSLDVAAVVASGNIAANYTKHKKQYKIKSAPSLTVVNNKGHPHAVPENKAKQVPPQIHALSPGSSSHVVASLGSSLGGESSPLQKEGDYHHHQQLQHDKLKDNQERHHHAASSWAAFPENNGNDRPDTPQDFHPKKPTRDIPDEIELPPSSVPSEPLSYSELSDCWGPFRCHRFTVSHKLMTSFVRQSLFLRRVMSILSAQYAVLIIWMTAVLIVPEINRITVDYFIFSYIPLGIFILSKLLLRSTVKIRKFNHWVLVLIACTRIICLAYYCGAVTAVSKNETILLTAILLHLSHSFFAVTTRFVDYDVRNSEIIGMSAVVNLMFSILIAFPYVICNMEASTLFDILLLTWLPSFIASQIIMMFLIFDMKQIMTGWRFPLSEADWMFTVLYL